MFNGWCGLNKFSERDIRFLKNLYKKTIRDIDVQIKNIFDQINNNAIFIITSDHGEIINNDGFIGHQFSFSNDLLEIPLIIYHPKMKNRTIKGRSYYY